MMSTLTPLQEAVEQQLLAPSNESPKLDLLIDDLCTQVSSDMVVLFRRISTPKMASQVVNQCYTAICDLLDQLWCSPQFSSCFEAIEKLYFRFELSFSLYLQADNSPPAHLKQQLHEEIDNRLCAICSKLGDKGIPESYILELPYALKSLFNPNKQPPCYYTHLSYLPRLLDGLEDLANDDRDKSWEDRFVFLMIHFNFNYPGFFNRWTERLSQTLEQLDTPHEQQEYLTHIELQLKLSHYDTGLCFNLSGEPLLRQMLQYVSTAIDKIEEDRRNSVLDQEDALLTRLSGNDLNLLFYYFYRLKMLDYPNKREAAKAFSQYIMSTTGRRISYKTLEKFERESLAPSAIRIKRLLKAIIQAIDQDFND